MGQWLVTLGRLDICYAMSSLGHFLCCPWEGHLSIGLCADDPMFADSLQEFKADFKDQYWYATEELDPAFPEPNGQPLMTTIFFDSDHAFNTAMRRLITSVLVE